MKTLLLALGAVALLAATAFLLTKEPVSLSQNNDMKAQFDSWCQKYNVKMASPEEEKYRLTVFTNNYNKIQSHPKTSSYTLGENQFMIITNQEFKQTYLGLKGQKPAMSVFEQHVSTGVSASSVDWRTKGKVQQVKDQGQCGSCWAFSTVASLESVSAVFGSGLLNLAEQDLVDCSSSYGNMGCNGGLMDYAFQYVIDHGIAKESDYPYKAVDGKCKSSVARDFKISKFTDVPSGNCNSLQNAVNQQPISIGVDAESWQFYSGGVFSDCGTQLDHGVALVGYDFTGDDNSSYWIVKNSWGTSWGEDGFIRLAKGNTCGICNTASYPSL